MCSSRLLFLQKERRSYFEDLRLNLEMRKPKYDSTVNPHKDSLTKKKQSTGCVADVTMRCRVTNECV